MKPPDFEALRAGERGCPSDFALDRYGAGELEGEKAGEIASHLAGCRTCAARVETRRFEAMPDVDPRALLARIRTRLDEPVAWWARMAAWLRRLRVPLAVAAGAAAVLVVLPSLRPPMTGHGIGAGADASDGVRAGGRLALHVQRIRGGAAEEVPSGARFAPGDTLRFVVDLPADGHVAVVGLGAGGRLYTAWPVAGAGGAAQTLRSAGARQELPGAVSLDDSRGRETLYVVYCPVAVGPPVCRAPGAAGGPPAGRDGWAPATCARDKGP